MAGITDGVRRRRDERHEAEREQYHQRQMEMMDNSLRSVQSTSLDPFLQAAQARRESMYQQEYMLKQEMSSEPEVFEYSFGNIYINKRITRTGHEIFGRFTEEQVHEIAKAFSAKSRKLSGEIGNALR